jgi:hypothetical protein
MQFFVFCLLSFSFNNACFILFFVLSYFYLIAVLPCGRSFIMIIWRRDEVTGITCGINDDGVLFLGNDYSGYNLPDTPENREYILNDFDCR